MKRGSRAILSWYESAAEARFAPVMLNLATMYYESDWTEKDLSKAFELYSKVADTGDGMPYSWWAECTSRASAWRRIGKGFRVLRKGCGRRQQTRPGTGREHLP